MKTKDLKLELEINPIIKIQIKPGQEVLPILTKSLESVSRHIQIIQNLDVPEDALAEAKKTNGEVKKVSISGHLQALIKEHNCYLVSYETSRGRELGQCKTYTSKDLEKLAESQ